MTLPKDQQLSTKPVRAAFIGGRAGGVTKLTDFEDGPIALQNPAEGIMYQIWRTRVVQGEVLLSGRYTQEAKLTELGGDIEEISFTFDRNGRHIMVFVQAGVTKMRWYNSQTAQYETRIFGSSYKTPRLFHDDKRPEAAATSDVVFFYVRDNKVCYALQRDRFDVEHVLQDYTAYGINKVGIMNNWRIGLLMETEPLRDRIIGSVDDIEPDEEIVYGKVAIPEDGCKVGIKIKGGPALINWGDGTIEEIETNGAVLHEYDYNAIEIDIDKSYRKPIWYSLEPASNAPITGLSYGNTDVGLASGEKSPITDIIVSLSDLTSFSLYNTNLTGSPLSELRNISLVKHNLTGTAIFNDRSELERSQMGRGNPNLTSIYLNSVHKFGSCSDLFLDCPNISTLHLKEVPSADIISNSGLNVMKIAEFRADIGGGYTNISGLLSPLQQIERLYLYNLDNVSGGVSSLSLNQLIRLELHGYTGNISVQNADLDEWTLNSLFESLGEVSGAQINVTGCPGASTCDPSMAVDKGWVVVGA